MQHIKINLLIVICLILILAKNSYSASVGPIYAFTRMNTPVVINLRDYVTELIKTKISSKPVNGKASLQTSDVIEYIPNHGYVGSDTALVIIQTENNITHVATAKIIVGEPLPDNIKKITLEWPPSPDEYLLSYEIFYGSSVNRILQKLPESYTEQVNLKEPFLTLEVDRDLNMKGNNQVCFQITAHNTIGESNHYEPICKNVNP